jgi:hypothetical protein
MNGLRTAAECLSRLIIVLNLLNRKTQGGKPGLGYVSSTTALKVNGESMPPAEILFLV